MKISLITVCHNSQEYLQCTIDSVYSQDYQNIEYILIDGGSTDGTLEIIKSNQDKFGDKLKYISEPDNGLYDAMNKGIRMATGEVVGTLNSDDFFTSNTILSEIAKGFTESDCEIIYGDIHFVKPGAEDKLTRYYFSALFRRPFMRFGFIPAHPSFYTYKHHFEKLGYYRTDLKIAADFDLLSRFIFVAKLKTKYLKLDFVTMRTGGVSTQSTQNRLLITKEIKQALREQNIYTNSLFLNSRYLYKIFELLISKFKR